MTTKKTCFRATFGAPLLVACVAVPYVALAQVSVPVEEARTVAVAPRTAATDSGTASTSSRKAAISLALYAGEVRVVPEAGVVRVAIGNGGVISATVVENRQIVLLGEKAGTSSLHVWLRNGSQIHYEVTVSPDNTAKIADELRQLLSFDSGITVKAVGSRVVLDGTYTDVSSEAKIKKIVAAYPKILNLVLARPGLQTVIPEPMVQLEVKVVQVRKQALDNIGVKWSNLGVAGPTFATSGLFYANSASFRGVNQTEGYPITTPAHPFISYLGLTTQIASVLNFLESNGDSWTLAEPRISSVSGGSAKVQVGGEIPIPVSSGLGQISVVYKSYGVILEFKPVIDKAGNVRSSIVAEVSEPDRSHGSGEFVAFTTTRTETEVSLKQNETLVISGLLKNTGARNAEGIPGIGRIPVIGRLFSTKEWTSDQTEMLVVVTPRLHVPSPDREQVLAKESANQHLNAIKSFVEQKLAR
ncbi:MAG: pilus assembly protein N-terminal domain-containing protein [Burkholderiaceae bacterium]|jgi:pilus assembly protein CpaC|nr:pilus assembly protein N-terminal domain-containing protein [Burkholderiaceae bacterium]